MKRFRIIILLCAWFLFNQQSKVTNPWVVVHVDGNTTIKVRNSFYYEYLELSMLSEKQNRELIRKYYNDSLKYKRWERIEKYQIKDVRLNYYKTKNNLHETIIFKKEE